MSGTEKESTEDLTLKGTIEQTRETMVLTQDRVVKDETPKEQVGQEPDHHKYEILRKLGKGGFAWVYLARNLDLDRLEAMKILNADVTEDETVINQIVKEARISANFHHQNIVTVFEVRKKGYWDIFKVEDKIKERHREPFAYFTMSYVDGQTATALLRQESRLNQKDAVRITIDACQALEYAHGKGIIHRDIKPDNIMVTRKGKAVLTDFGIAKVLDQTRQTAVGTFMGTARYVSPEQASGKDIDGRADLYSLGVTLYELLAGRVPFDSNQWMTVLYQHINDPPPDPDKFCHNLDRDLRNIILKMMEKVPSDRFQNAKEAGEALTQVYMKLGGEDRFTLPMDQIQTRRNTIARDATEVTEPPVRLTREESTAVKAKDEKETADDLAEHDFSEEKGSKKLLPLGILALVAVIIIAVLFWPGSKTEQPVDSTTDSTEETVALPPATGTLLVSAFPKGTIQKITDADGNEVSVSNPNLPWKMELPEGTYEIIISYRNQTRTETATVLSGMPLSQVNAVFDIEEDAFLLEDLR